MNGSDSRRPGAPAPYDRAQGGLSPRQGGNSATQWRESQPLPPEREASESPRVAVASPPARTSSGWLREPALDPRRLMPPPRRDGVTERSFSPAPARQESSGPPPPARQSEPLRPSAPPPSNNGRGRFTERPAPVESAAPPEILEPPDPQEREAEATQSPRFIAPPPAEPPRGRVAATAPQAGLSAAPPAEEQHFEIEPARPIVPPLWERLRDHTPLFRSESKRSQESESNLAPHRFIAPSPLEQAPEKAAAAAPEPAPSFAPVP